MIAPRRFWFLLSLVTAFAVLSMFIWKWTLPATEALSPFTFWCLVAFVLVNILAYYSGIRAVNSASPYRFVHLMMGLILLKMVICIGLVVAHVKFNNPESRLFVLPFLSAYLIFTLFEIYVLEKIARKERQTTGK